MGNSSELIQIPFSSTRTTARLSLLMAWREELEEWREAVFFFQNSLRLGYVNIGADTLQLFIQGLAATKKEVIPALENLIDNALLQEENLVPRDFRSIEERMENERRQWVALKRQLLPCLGNLHTISFW